VNLIAAVGGVLISMDHSLTTYEIYLISTSRCVAAICFL